MSLSLQQYRSQLGLPHYDAIQADQGDQKVATLITAASEFLSGFNVTHFFTLTYGSEIGHGRRIQHFKEWIDAQEWLQHRPLGWLRADEVKRYSGLGFPAVPEHHHGLLFGADDCRHAESIWKSIAGDGEVLRYEQGGGAIPYSLKLAFQRVCDWDLGGLKGFRQLRGQCIRSDKTYVRM